MNIKKYIVEISQKAMKYTPENALFFDLETTGLKKERDIISILACAYYENDFLHIFQWINDDAVSEESMLQEFYELLQQRKWKLISYNGESFDLPFLKCHFQYNDLDVNVLDQLASMDLYQVFRGFLPLLGLENGKQKTVENHLGIHRIDQLSGKNIVSAYKTYLKTKNQDDINPLILHNMEDIKGLAYLMELMPLKQIGNCQFNIAGLMEDTYDDQPAITFLLELEEDIHQMIQIDSELGGFEMRDLRTGFVRIPYKENKMYHFYENYKDYYYLPDEDRAIHKSIGSFVDKDHRKKATAKTCYISKNGIFLPLSKEENTYGFHVSYNEIQFPIYRQEYEEKQTYYDFDDLFAEGSISKEVNSYIASFLQSIFLNAIRNID